MILPEGTHIILHQKIGYEPFEWNYNNKKPEVREVEAKVLSESKMCVMVELSETGIKCNIPKRFFTSKGSNLNATPPTISIPVGFNISPLDESEKEYINPLDKPEKMEVQTPPMMADKPLMIFKKMIAVMKEIDAIGKNQTAETFSFRGIDDVYNAINPIFKHHGIFCTTEVLSQSTNQQGKTIVNAKFTFYAKDGSSVASTVCGEAITKDDKGSAIALSVAHRICLTQMFCIPVDARDWLSQQQFQKALLRINGGDKLLLEKIQKEFRIKSNHLKMLAEAHKNKQQTPDKK